MIFLLFMASVLSWPPGSNIDQRVFIYFCLSSFFLLSTHFLVKFMKANFLVFFLLFTASFWSRSLEYSLLSLFLSLFPFRHIRNKSDTFLRFFALIAHAHPLFASVQRSVAAVPGQFDK